MVTAMGRSGSTWLMHILSQHPSIVVAGAYPYEFQYARSRMEKVKYAATGFTQRRQLRLAARDILDRYERLGAKRREDTLASPVYFAEKNLRPEWLFWEAFSGARELFLVRDFRDMICSSLAFNAKRGRTKFGREQVGSDLAYVRFRAAQARPWILEPWRARSERAHLVRYEDLIRSPTATLRGIFTYLGLEADAVSIAAALDAARATSAALSRHRTTASPDASIGRWTRDLSGQMRGECEKHFAELLMEFNYPIGIEM